MRRKHPAPGLRAPWLTLGLSLSLLGAPSLWAQLPPPGEAPSETQLKTAVLPPEGDYLQAADLKKLHADVLAEVSALKLFSAIDPAVIQVQVDLLEAMDIRCGARVECLVRLGRLAGAQAMISLKAEWRREGTTVQLVLIEVERGGGGVKNRVDVTLAEIEDTFTLRRAVRRLLIPESFSAALEVKAPPRARVFLDDKLLGEGEEVRAGYLEQGPHALRVELPGGRKLERSVTLVAWQTATVDLRDSAR